MDKKKRDDSNSIFMRVAMIVKELQKQNYSQEEIREQLSKKGWNSNQINLIFNLVKSKKIKIRHKLHVAKLTKKRLKLHKHHKIKKLKKSKFKKIRKIKFLRHKLKKTENKSKYIKVKKLRKIKKEHVLIAPGAPEKSFKEKKEVKKPSAKLLNLKFLFKRKKNVSHENLPEKKVEPKIDENKFKLALKEPKGVAETDFDRLVNFVNEAGVIKLSHVAKLFNINIKKAEEWSKILADHNLLLLHYPGIGEPELKKWKK